MSSEITDGPERLFLEKGVQAQPTRTTGWGLFANRRFSPGEPIFWVDLQEKKRSKILPLKDSFGPLSDRSVTMIPGYAVCLTDQHPFWFVNHACRSNCGFGDWGAFTGHRVPFVAFRHIDPGEQITCDYALLTAPGEGSLDGDDWQLMGCGCGSRICRHNVTDFRHLDRQLQQAAILPAEAPQGRLMAHVLAHEPHLVSLLQQRRPEEYARYETALRMQQELADYVVHRVK